MEVRRTTKPFKIVHLDVCGPIKTESMGDARNSSFDDCSRKVWVYILKSKECLEKFEDFNALVKTQLEYKIKVFQSDNGGEVIYEEFQHFFNEH